MTEFSLIYCVVNYGDASKVIKSARKYGVKSVSISIGRGTAHSRLLEVLALNEIRKEVVTLIIESELVNDAIKGITKDMAFEKPHHGIAFSFSISELISSKGQVGATKNKEVESAMYKAIYVIVERGKAEDVIDAANKAGARGGTIMNARGAGIQKAQKLFSVEIEPEQEEVFIIVKNEFKDGIVESISKHIRVDEPGNGIMFVLDVDEAYGLH
jgi:nitrogen regulatory protein PII